VPASSVEGVDLAAIERARAAIAGHIRQTPTWPSMTLEEQLGVPVLLKCEQMQRTGSFKIRGATNFINGLGAEQRAHGLVAASAGNHAQGVALAGTLQGIDVTVVMPLSAPLAKANAARGYGARVVLSGQSLEEARTEALTIADREGRTFVPPFDSDAVIAGQGTLGLEILEQCPEVEEILVPTGGGGLLAGIAVAVKALKPSVRVVGVQSSAMDGVCQSFAARRLITTPHERTIADGAAVAGPSERTLALIERNVDAMVSVGDDAVARAIVLLIERSKMVVEGAGALAVAALQSGAYRPVGTTVAVLSGGNIDVNLLGSIVRHGLVEAGRYQHLAIEVTDQPGELAWVAQAVAEAGANIIDVNHNRDAPGMPVGVAILEFLLEVHGREHFEEIVQALGERGLGSAHNGGDRLTTASALRQRHND
jgi:threonine dehydratase